MDHNSHVDWYTIRDLEKNLDVYSTSNRNDAVKWLSCYDNLERYRVDVLKYEPRAYTIPAHKFVQESDNGH